MAEDGDALKQFRNAWWQRLLSDESTYELTRFAVLRLLGLVYLVAFLILAFQMDPLIGSRGLLPAHDLLSRLHDGLGAGAYWRLPTFFWASDSDAAMHVLCAAGIALSVASLLGVTNAIVQLALWGIYTSFVHVGQIFYGYGWEMQLLETGFLSVFLCPVRGWRPLPATSVPVVTIWLLRWLVFRVMVGAALIKLRNAACWTHFTCLDYHFETQPNPNPLAWWLHHAPHGVHVFGVAFNHFVELVVPWFAFGFRRWRHIAGILLVVFQVTLILSGNLSFLNWLMIVPALACFDDTAWTRLLPTRFRGSVVERFARLPRSRPQVIAAGVYAVLVAVLSVPVVLNLLSSRQVMNAHFEPLMLVNTYGAFGDVDRARYEVILEGTRDEEPDASARWEEYELPCQPGDVHRRPCLITPYHYRLDWQFWFVGNTAPRGYVGDNEEWLLHLVWQLLRGEPGPDRLLARNPFRDSPPKWIRVGIWHYAFSDNRRDGAWWQRRRVSQLIPPVSLDDPELGEYVELHGWGDALP